MTEPRRTSFCDDLTHEIGIARGLGFTIERAAEVCGASESTVKRRLAEPSTIQIEALTKKLLALSEQKIAEVAFEDAKSRISRILAKSLGASERLVDEALASGDFTQLLTAHKVGEWAARFEVSEAPKRLKVEQSHEHSLSEDTIRRLEGIDRLMSQYERLLPEPRPVIDIEPLPAN